MAVAIKDNSCQIIEFNGDTFKISTTIHSEDSISRKDGCLNSLKINQTNLFLGFENGNLKIYDSDYQFLSVINLNHSILSMDIIENIIITSNPENYLCSLRFDEKSGNFEILKKREIPTEGISHLKIRGDKKILAAGSWDNTVRLFSVKRPGNLKPLGALKFHEKAVDSLAVTESLIAAGSTDGYVSIWKVYVE